MRNRWIQGFDVAKFGPKYPRFVVAARIFGSKFASRDNQRSSIPWNSQQMMDHWSRYRWVEAAKSPPNVISFKVNVQIAYLLILISQYIQLQFQVKFKFLETSQTCKLFPAPGDKELSCRNKLNFEILSYKVKLDNGFLAACLLSKWWKEVMKSSENRPRHAFRGRKVQCNVKDKVMSSFIPSRSINLTRVLCYPRFVQLG